MKILEKQSIQQWIETLEKVDPKEKNSKVAARILKLASLPKRKRVAVNLNKLSRYANAGEHVVVPGKILSTGYLNKKFELSAVECSEAASKKLKAAGCSMVSLQEMLKKENLKVIM